MACGMENKAVVFFGIQNLSRWLVNACFLFQKKCWVGLELWLRVKTIPSIVILCGHSFGFGNQFYSCNSRVWSPHSQAIRVLTCLELVHWTGEGLKLIGSRVSTELRAVMRMGSGTSSSTYSSRGTMVIFQRLRKTSLPQDLCPTFEGEKKKTKI